MEAEVLGRIVCFEGSIFNLGQLDESYRRNLFLHTAIKVINGLSRKVLSKSERTKNEQQEKVLEKEKLQEERASTTFLDLLL